MTRPTEMTSLSYVLEKLRMRRQDNEFIMDGEQLAAPNGKKYEPTDLKIIKTYRFEGDSNPSDASILYIIEANDGLIGYSIDAYGAYSNHEENYDDFIRKISVEDRDEQILFN
jgi:hypothetical protein